ncbi:hypothetical protein [Pantoea rwandensis]|uniref:Transcriptional regulator n=1 Tax=Pantoea rwandensis TaxID=1076550 RepID=A0ABM5RGX7_9GAMM|nr:hypothetical protein [Pantoea rwandensis]AIR85238.1 hypothetical protein LH22_07055 [Pantoea rwandensis]
MSTIETLRAMSEVWSLFSDMPDDATVGVDLAALYLGVSVKTLARYRQNGDGPPYVQYQSSDSKARNQRVNYLLGDLRSWRNGHRVNNTMQAAQVRRLTFSTLSDLTKPQPFWIFKSQIVIGHALCIEDYIFKSFLISNDYQVIWICVNDVLLEKWSFSTERKKWHSVLVYVLNRRILNSVAQQEKNELYEALMNTNKIP